MKEGTPENLKHNFKFTYNNRIKKRQAFLHIQKNANKFFSKHFIFAILNSNTDKNKLGITVSTKVDKRAVVRNRLKRYIRDIFRLNQFKFINNLSIVVVAKKHASNCTYFDVKKEFLGCLHYNKFLKGSNEKDRK